MADATVVRPPAASRDVVQRWLRDRGVYVALAAIVVFNVAFTNNFLTVSNLRLQLIEATPVIIVALGMALVIGTEGIDLSVGATMALAAAVIPLYLYYGAVPAMLMALLAGLVVGLVNGTLVAVVGIQPIIATLGILVGGRGLALVFADNRLKEVFDPTLATIGSGQIAGIPYSVLIAGVLTLLTAVLVRRTTFGRRVLAIGGNREASVLAGLPVRRILVLVYVISGLFAATAGIISTGRLGASNPSYVGLLIELSAITAVVVGGTPLTGGRVRILGTVMGALLMQLIVSTLVSHDLRDSDARMMQAAIIIAAVYLQRDRSRS